MGEIGSVEVGVYPDARAFWTRFRAQTSGQAENEGRRQGSEFRRGMEESTARPIRIRADVDTAGARAELKSLERQGNQSGGGLLKALLPLAPALAPLAAATIAAGSGLAVLGGAGILAVTGLKREMAGASDTGQQAALAVGAVKRELHTLQATASKAALPGLQSAVVSIRRELPALRSAIGEQAAVAGDVISHLTHGIAAGFTTFRPIISAVGADVDSLAAHFDAFASGPGGAHFAKTLATDYAEVKPVIESVVRAVVDIARAGSQGGLGILHILGELANVIDSFPTPVLTAIVDGFLLFRAVGVASAAIAGVQRSFAGVKSAAAGVAAATQLASTQRIAAETAAAAATVESEAVAAEAMLATAEAARAELLAVATSRGSLSADQTAAMQVQLGIADREIASYEAVALAARASAAEQAAAAEAAAGAAAGARGAAGAGSLLGTFGKFLGPIALVATALPLLSSLFGDNGQSAQQAASEVSGYTSALIASKGAIDATVVSQAAAVLSGRGVFDYIRGSAVTQQQLTAAVLAGGSALDAVIVKIDAYRKSQGDTPLQIGLFNRGLREQNSLFTQSASAAADQTAAIDKVTAADRNHAAALHSTVGAYTAARDAAAGNVEKTQEQTVAFQLANDAASLLSQALDRLAGKNLGVAQSHTAFEQSINSTTDALKKNHDAIRGNSAAALEDQAAVQGTVASARQAADAIAKQTGSSVKASAAYRRSRDELLSQLKAQGQLTPAVRKYINTLFDVGGVSAYLKAHPTKLDVNTEAGRAKLHQLQGDIDSIRQRQATGIGIDDIAALNEISRIQATIDALHGKTVVVTTISSDGSSISVGSGGRGFRKASGGYISGPGSGTSDSIPAWLSNGEYVINAKATAKHRHLLENINKGARGFAAGGPVTTGTVGGKTVYIFNGIRYSSQTAALNAQTRAQQKSTTNLPTQIQNAISGIGRSASAPFDINQQGFRAIAAQISHAQRLLASWHVPLAKTLKYEQEIIHASTVLQHQLQNLRLKINGADLKAISGAIGGTADQVRSSYQALITDLRNSGASALNISRVRKQEQAAVAANNRYTAGRDYSSSIRSTLAGTFDPTKFGSVTDLVAGLSGQTGQNNAFAKELSKLRGKTKGNKTLTSFINQLAASGQTTTLESLAGASKGDLTNLTKSLGAYGSSLSAGADSATTSKFGETANQLHHDVNKIVSHTDGWVHSLGAAVGKLAHAVGEAHKHSDAHTNRQIDGALRELETAVRHGRR